MSTPTTSEALAAATTLVPLRVPAAHEVCADRLERAIHSGMFVTGERLPSERDLARAARRLARDAARGARPPGGLGPPRAHPRAPRAGRSSPRPTRRCCAPGCSPGSTSSPTSRSSARSSKAARRGLAAERAGPAEHAALRAALDALPEDDPRAFRRADTAFHLAVAHAAGNAVLLARSPTRASACSRSATPCPGTSCSRPHAPGTSPWSRRSRRATATRARAAMEAHVAIAQRELEQVLRGGPARPAELGAAPRAHRPPRVEQPERLRPHGVAADLLALAHDLAGVQPRHRVPGELRSTGTRSPASPRGGTASPGAARSGTPPGPPRCAPSSTAPGGTVSCSKCH